MKKKIELPFFKSKKNEILFNKGVKLHLGCGDVRLEGWVNVDARKTAAVDVCENIVFLPSFKDETIDVIYACHVLEHTALTSSATGVSYQKALERWFRLLRKGGMLFVAVPDLHQVFKGIKKFDGDRHQDAFLRALYGGQEYRENIHYCGFTKKRLTKCLIDAGFTEVDEFSSFAEDTSGFSMFGIPISLNLVGVKK